ncbi:MAG: spore maturation protein [Bacillota bacterium]
MVLVIPVYGYLKGVPVYEAFIEGASEGLLVVARIVPYLVAILVVLGIFRDSGALGWLVGFMQPVLGPLGVPGETIPLLFIRPMSGGAALGIVANLINTYGPDSFIGRLASTIQGSTDTTLYVLTLYFGSVGIKKYRYALKVGLLADLAGFIASVVICHLVFG